MRPRQRRTVKKSPANTRVKNRQMRLGTNNRGKMQTTNNPSPAAIPMACRIRNDFQDAAPETMRMRSMTPPAYSPACDPACENIHFQRLEQFSFDHRANRPEHENSTLETSSRRTAALSRTQAILDRRRPLCLGIRRTSSFGLSPAVSDSTGGNGGGLFREGKENQVASSVSQAGFQSDIVSFQTSVFGTIRPDLIKSTASFSSTGPAMTRLFS